MGKNATGSMVYKTEVKRSKKKLDKGQLSERKGSAIGAIFWLGLGGFLVYSSLFYIGAFVDVGKIVGVSSKTMDLDDGRQGIRKITAPVTEMSKYKKIYMRENQAIGIEYSVPEGSTIKLHVLQCKNRPVIEVFDCAPIGQRTVDIENKTNGSSTIFVSEPGFYYFADEVTVPQGKKAKYEIVWRRV